MFYLTQGQKYDPHYDYFHDPVNASPKRGGQRMATMLIYLADTERYGLGPFTKSRLPVLPIVQSNYSLTSRKIDTLFLQQKRRRDDIPKGEETGAF